MWTNRLPRLDVLNEEQAESIHDAALTLLEEIGVCFAFEPALRRFRDAGVATEDDLVRLDRGFVTEQLAKAPREFRLHARNPERSLTIGGDHLALAPTGGAPFVLDPERGRRSPTAEDHATFVRFTHAVPVFDLNESGIVEPDDLPVPTRHLDMDLDVLRWSDKPYFPVGATYESSRDSVDLAAIVFGGRDAIAERPLMLGIVNPISPLSFDERMAGSAVAYAEGGQPVVFMPFVFAGGTAPLGLAGAVAQMEAEVLAGLCLVQLVRPGNPVVMGSSVSELDLHDGQPRYATAFHGLAMLASGQMARRLGLPFRGGGGFTSSATPDVRAMQESLMALWPALLCGPHVILHAAGWVEGSLATSIEKMAQDVAALEVFEGLLANEIPVDEDALSLEAFREVGPGGTFLGAAHTLRHFRETAARQAHEPLDWRAWLDRYEDPGLDPAIQAELEAFVARRRTEALAAGV
ncbi:MAG TPA: trimethylamine methyltransferase family protein [Actinomycetota bacterium]|nr:trimethylamine methyltransferase family protein [Actinomycetota bacterium]